MSKFLPNSLFKESNFRMQLKPDTPEVEVMVTVASIPGISLGEIIIPRPVVKDKRPGDLVGFDDLILSINVDENLIVYKEIISAIYQTSNPETSDLDISSPIFDGSLMLTTNKNNIQHHIRFYNSFFKAISPIRLVSSTSDEQHATFDLTIAYTHFAFI